MKSKAKSKSKVKPKAKGKVKVQAKAASKPAPKAKAKPNPVPEGYHTATPYLIVQGAAKALEFYRMAFNAIETMRMPMPDGRIGHAEIRIGNSAIMLADEHPEMGYVGPQALGGTPVSLMLYVTDADAMFTVATGLGASVIKPMENQFYGDRSGTIRDPFGHVWTVATHVEDLTPEEMQKRMPSAC